MPPATHTNMVLVGHERFWVVDPATMVQAEREVALEAVRSMVSEGRVAAGIVLTHHHQDHMGAAAWLREATGLPISAHPISRDLLTGILRVDHLLEEGDVLEGSDDPADHWRVLHTPGHASGHIVLWQEERRWMVAGDMVAEVGTIIIEPPDGHMATYMEQLERLAALGPEHLVPAHGEVIHTPVAHLQGYLEHRREREDRVLGALGPDPRPLGDITVDSYPDVHPSIHVLAERSCLAHLHKLEEERRAAQDDGGCWVLSLDHPGKATSTP